MKKTTLVFIAVVLLLVIVEESNGRITILIHGRVSANRKSRRRPITKKPKNSTRMERNHPKRKDDRLPVRYNRWHESPHWTTE
ncbi:hypothetical protein ACROYT_G006972 [Oculina patagonica]